MLILLGCSAPDSERLVPTFDPGDSIRLTSGGGRGSSDELILRADGTLTYRPLRGATRKKTLTPEQTQTLYQDLLELGLLELKNEPNRDLERYGFVLEAELGETSLRGSIGALEISRRKHQAWQAVVHRLSTQLGTNYEGEESEPLPYAR